MLLNREMCIIEENGWQQKKNGNRKENNRQWAMSKRHTKLKTTQKTMRNTVRVDRKRAEGTPAARICGYFLSCLKRVFTGTYTQKGWAQRERVKDWDRI